MRVVQVPEPEQQHSTSVGESPAGVDVAVLYWPEEARQRSTLLDRPRLLLVARQAPPPAIDDFFEDWIRLPASDADVSARVEGLARRWRKRDSLTSFEAEDVVTIDSDGRLQRGSTWFALSTIEAKLVRALLDADGAVVSREDLAAAAWPGEQPHRNVLDVQMVRLRRRVRPLGLAIRTVRARGYALETGPVPGLSET